MIIKVKAVNGFKKTDGCYNASDEIIKNLKISYQNEIVCDKNNIEEQEKKIFIESKNLLEKNKKLIFLGGDHSISFAIGKAFLEYCKQENKEPYFIVFDAHADCMIPEKNPSHESWLRALIEFGLNDKNVLTIGIRNIYEEEKNFFNYRFCKISLEDILLNIEDITDFITEAVNEENSLVYITIDMDVIDPAFSPAVVFPEPAGLLPQQILYIIKRISKLKNLKIIDLVEVDVAKDKNYNFITTKLAAKIIEQFLENGK